MKIYVIILAVLLVGMAAGGGIYIAGLNVQINDLAGQVNNLGTQAKDMESGLKAELASAAGELGNKLDETAAALGQTDTGLSGKIDKNTVAISSSQAAFSSFQDAANSHFSTIEDKVKAAGDLANQADRMAGETASIVDSSVLQGAALFEKVKKSIVRISDGTYVRGSGFVISGAIPYVVTANHVIEGLDTIYITFYDGRTWKAVVDITSVQVDVALLGLEVPAGQEDPGFSSFPAVGLADSSIVKPGDPVLLMGSPADDSNLGLQDSITTGVISQVKRAAIIGDQLNAGLLQFDAAANFGNSGGPLFNMNGDVIGLVVARMDPGVGDGISFAVESNLINRVRSAAGGSGQTGAVYAYPSVGITAADISPIDIVNNQNTVTSGAKVTVVSGPAAAAGIKAGDIITGMGNRAVRDSDEFMSYLVEFYAPGDSVLLEVIRGNNTLSITVIIAEAP